MPSLKDWGAIPYRWGCGHSSARSRCHARHCQYVHLDETGLTEAVADGVLACLQGVADVTGSALITWVAGHAPGVRGDRSGAARALHRRGSSDAFGHRRDRVSTLASELDSKVCGPDDAWSSAADVLAPCAVGGLLDERAAFTVAADAVCGAANNILSSSR